MAQGPWFNHYDDPDEYWDDDEPLSKSTKTPPSIPPAPAPSIPTSSHRAMTPASADPWEQPQSTSFPSQAGQSVPRSNGGAPGDNHPYSRGDAKRSDQLDDTVVNTWNLAGSSFASMQLDRGLLPIKIDLDRQWSYQVQPHEYETELLKAYDRAIAQELARILSSRSFLPDGGFDIDCGVPDRRTQLVILLETPRWSEYQVTLDAMIAKNGHRVTGRTLYQGEPAVHMTADRMRINSINIRSGWAGPLDPAVIVDELLWCADQIRSQRPKFNVRGDYSRYSVEDLEFQHDQHVRSLLEQVNYQ
jgi:hypothetical protein